MISSLPSPAIDGLLEALTRGDVGAGRDVEHRRVLKVEEELTLLFNVADSHTGPRATAKVRAIPISFKPWSGKPDSSKLG